MKNIVVINQKGGVGKTTTAAAIASGLKKKGYKVLAIDTDPQGNLTSSFGILEPALTIKEVFTDDLALKDVITDIDGIAIVPCSLIFSDADRRITQFSAHRILKRKLQEIKTTYDYCIIDAPPSLGILSLNDLVAADYLIIPVNASAFSIQGISYLDEIITQVKQEDNKSLVILGILLTRFNHRTNIGKDSVEALTKIASLMNTSLFDTKIRQGIAIEMAQASHVDIFSYAPSSIIAKEYDALVDEIIKRIDSIEIKGENL